MEKVFINGEMAKNMKVNGKTITWSAKDTFTAPVFSEIEHSVEENTFLIHIHDKPLQEKLGYFEERSI